MPNLDFPPIDKPSDDIPMHEIKQQVLDDLNSLFDGISRPVLSEKEVENFNLKLKENPELLSEYSYYPYIEENRTDHVDYGNIEWSNPPRTYASDLNKGDDIVLPPKPGGTGPMIPKDGILL